MTATASVTCRPTRPASSPPRHTFGWATAWIWPATLAPARARALGHRQAERGAAPRVEMLLRPEAAPERAQAMEPVAALAAAVQAAAAQAEAHREPELGLVVVQELAAAIQGAAVAA